MVDAGSSDGTVDGCRGRVRVISSPRGRAAQQNAGARVAAGSVLWFLHADSVPPRGAVGEIEAACAAGATAGFFRIAFPAAEKRRHFLLPWIERGINTRTRVTRTATGDQGLFVRRDLFQRLGGFPAWPLFEDVALSRAIRRAGRPVLCRGPVETSARRWLAGGVVPTMGRMWVLRMGFMLGLPAHRLARLWRQKPEP